jgi:hypothetical protein
MRSEASSRSHDFTLTLPGPAAADQRVQEIIHRGNLPLLIGEDVIAEISRADLEESWQTALELTPPQLAEMTRIAGLRLADMIEQGLESEDLTEVVSDATALFLLAMRRHGVTSASRIPPCSVRWSGQQASEQVLMLGHGLHS